MRILAAFILAIGSFQAHAVCMSELDAQAYGCVPMTQNAEALQWCRGKYGEKFRPYVTDSICAKELAATLRGESFDSSASSEPQTVVAACMTYEQGMEKGCDYYNYNPAQRYCAQNYGNRFIPFVPQGKCSLQEASRLRGEVSGERLVEGLASPMDEIETIMTMVDREGLNPLGGLDSKKPKIGNEFYNDIVQALMAKMNMFKNDLYARGSLNARASDAQTLEYLRYAFRYLSVLGRLYKVYAFVAHENHYALRSYTFKNLEYLNLKLKKKHALEILAQVNYKAKTVNGGEDIEFFVGQQERQTYEYMAMQAPDTKTDYAKLVTFMGARENLTNLWGVQRMTAKKVDNGRIRNCGNFLSLRPGGYGEMDKSEAYKELFEYDVFYNDYAPRWEELVQASRKVSLLDGRSAMDMGDYVLRNVGELRELLENQAYNPLRSREDFMEQASKDAPMLLEAENEYWSEFSRNHFPSIVMPGDDVLSQEAVVSRIVEEAYKKRMRALKDVFVASYLWVSDEAVKEMEEKLQWFADKYLKDSFEKRLERELSKSLDDYNDSVELARKNRQTKEEQTYQTAIKAVVASNVLDAVKNETLDFRRMRTLEPENLQELMFLFQDRIEKNYFDVRQTLEHNEEMANLLNSFFKEVAQEYRKRFEGREDSLEDYLAGSQGQLAKGLRQIVFETGKRWFAKYPYKLLDYRLRPSPILDGLSDQDSIPVYPDGTPAGVSNERLLAVAAAGSNYVEAREDVSAVFGATDPVRRRGSRNNPDRVSRGLLGKPVELVSPGKIRTNRGHVEIDNSRLSALFRSYDFLSKRAQAIAKRAMEDEKRRKEPSGIGKMFVIKDPAKFFFRVFEVLRLEDIGMRAASFGRFAKDEDSQALLANNLVSQAYQTAPVLRSEVSWNRLFKKTCYSNYLGMPKNCDYRKEVKLPLLEKIASAAYERESGRFQPNKAKEMISKAFDDTIANTPNKLEKFCSANYLNYKNDENFKDVFKASKFLRSSLKSANGQSEGLIKRMEGLDESVKKEIRGRWEAWNEDYFEPSLHVLGTAAIVAFGVVLIIGTGGMATPGVLGGVYAAASAFLAVEFFVSFPLVAGSLYSRINTHFIETPAQLKFQTSLAVSQLEGKIVDWDMLNQDKANNKSSKMWTIGLMPLDFFYGAMLVRHVRVEAGVVGRAAYHRLTGAKLRGWSAPPKSMLNNPRFGELRSRLGTRRAILAKAGQAVNRGRSFMPKYQSLPENMLRSTALRMGMIRKAKSLSLSAKPWAILDDLRSHGDKLKSRLSDYQRYVGAEQKVVSELRLKGGLKPGEALRHFDKTAAFFVPATLWRRVKALDGKGVLDFFTRFGEVWDELKTLQGAVVKQRAESIELAAKKLEDFQKGVQAGFHKGDDLMARYLETVSDNELLSLQEVAKKSEGVFRHFKPVFKDYQRVVQGLRPMSYLRAYGGKSFASAGYSQTYTLDGQLNANYAFESDAQDLMNFYESMMKNHGRKGQEFDRAREAVEEAMARELRP